MYLTFSEEPSYGEDSTSQDYVIDLLEENIIDNINYQKIREFNFPTRQSRVNGIKTINGRTKFAFTYGNEAWNILFKTIMGQKIRLTDFAFARSVEKWNIITGMLSENIDSSQTTFTITEYKTGEFDNIDGIIIDNEYINVNTINNGSVISSDRHSEGTTAVLHTKNALVYGVVISGGNTLDIISRYRNGFSYVLPTSLTCLIYRDGDYFCFNGIQLSDFVFNARPSEGIEASFNLRGRDARVIEMASPSLVADNEQEVNTDQINCYSMNNWIDIAKFYFEISNTLTPGSAKFLNNTHEGLILNQFSTYGQFSATESTLEFYNDYINDEERNLSITICNSKFFDKAFVFAFNKTRYGTLQHILRTTRLIYDSVPYYVYEQYSHSFKKYGEYKRTIGGGINDIDVNGRKLMINIKGITQTQFDDIRKRCALNKIVDFIDFIPISEKNQQTRVVYEDLGSETIDSETIYSYIPTYKILILEFVPVFENNVVSYTISGEEI